MYILAIETSCDETSVSINKDGVAVLSNVISSSSNLFYETGGVVPEVASRKQLEYIIPVCNKALKIAGVDFKDIDYIAVTVGPGLMGSLLVGVTFAKTLSLIFNKPVIPVNHLYGHIYSAFISNYLGENLGTKVSFPIVALVISGGHTDLVYLPDSSSTKYLGGTRDDASGEAFDKVARILKLSNYLGGPKLSNLAATFDINNSKGLKLPRPLIDSDDFDFSFSGLKTAVIKEVGAFEKDEVSYQFEQAVVDVLLYKTNKAFKTYKPSNIVVCGGVSANKAIRSAFIEKFNDKVIFPRFELCTDNAAMIGCAAFFNLKNATFDLDQITPDPSLSLQNLT